MEITETPPPLTLEIVIELLRKALFAWCGRAPLTVAVMGLIFNRLGVVAARLERMAARFKAGRAMSRGPRPSPVVEAGVEVAGGTLVPGKPVARFWPVGFGWLVEMKRHEAAWFSQAVERLLREPEMVGLLGASTEARKLLRPMCRMLGVDPALLRPVVAGEAVDEVVAVKTPRVRRRAPPVDIGRVPLPRGVATWVRREKRLGRFKSEV